MTAMKWYEEDGPDNDVIVASRIRLVRNFSDFKFPWKMDSKEAEELTETMSRKLGSLGSLDGRSYVSYNMSDLDQQKRNALRERRVIGRSVVDQPEHAGLLLSADESVSLTLNGEDHVRIQVSHSGSQLNQAWRETDRIDDYVNENYSYAFDDKVGYLTTYPTNLGTGMRAYQILHLPLLDAVSRFDDIVSEIGRYGLKLKPAFNSDRKINGNMYVLYNEKTLGITEQEILQVLEKVSGQLMNQERSLRDNSVSKHRIEAEDICYKAYGTLRYSKLLTMRMAMNLLSQLRWGQERDIISFRNYCNFYEIMMGIQQANLMLNSEEPADDSKQNQMRAAYVKRKLPELRQDR